jgi:hypothetical protein
MSSDNESAGLKISREMLETLAVPIIVKQVVASGLFKSHELKVLFDKGKGSVETGIREIGSILARGDIPDPDTWNKGIRQIIIGAIKVGVFLAASKSRAGPSKGGKKARKKAMDQSKKWKEHVRTRTHDLFKENPKWPGTTIRDVIKKETPRPLGIRLPDGREMYEKAVLPELRKLKKGIK